MTDMALLERKTAELGRDVNGDTLLVDVDPGREHVRFRIGKHEVMVSLAELWGFCFMVADEETQEKLLPVRQTEVMHYEKIHTIQLKKDMKRGQVVRARCHIDVPLTVVEGLQGMVKRQALPSGNSGLILPV